MGEAMTTKQKHTLGIDSFTLHVLAMALMRAKAEKREALTTGRGRIACYALSALALAVCLLGGQLSDSISYSLPDGSSRTLICIKKISQTSTKYPRNAAKMAKSPLA